VTGMKRLAVLLCSLALLSQGFAADRAFGWKPDKPGIVKRQFLSLGLRADSIKPRTDLSAGFPDVYDQGLLGSCSAQAGVAAFEMKWKEATGRFMYGSTLGLYYDNRVHDGTVREDAGSYIATTIRMLQKKGVGLEKCWPYRIQQFAQAPPSCYRTAADGHRLAQGFNLSNTDRKSIRIALSNDMPVIFGAYVYGGIDNVEGPDFILDMPRSGESPQGGHAMVIVGHDDSTRLYRVRNSWGAKWGDKGHFFVPYDYIENGRICEDFWAVGLVATPPPSKATRRWSLFSNIMTP